MTFGKTAFTIFLGVSLVGLLALFIYSAKFNNHLLAPYHDDSSDSAFQNFKGYLTSQVRKILIQNGFNVSLPSCPRHEPLKPGENNYSIRMNIFFLGYNFVRLYRAFISANLSLAQ